MSNSYFSQNNAKTVFSKYFPGAANTQRKLRSIAFHLEISIDIANSKNDELVIAIGDFLIRKFNISVHQSWGAPASEVPPKIDPDNILDKIVNRHHVPEANFEFLKRFSIKSIEAKLKRTEVSFRLLPNLQFKNSQDVEVVLGYLCDVSSAKTTKIISELNNLERAIQAMQHSWHRFIAWFDNEEKIRAANFYSGKRVVDEKEAKANPLARKDAKFYLMPIVMGKDDIEIFFHDPYCPDQHKEFVYTKIRNLYNTRSSRKNSRQKNCSFVLDSEAKSLIEAIAKEQKIKGSDLLNFIFQKSNKPELNRLLEKMPVTARR